MKLQNFLFAKAEELLIQRRLKIRYKKIDTIKKIIDPKKDFDAKSSRIDRLIELETKFFGLGIATEAAIEINEI
jgi:hypothetical protein